MTNPNPALPRIAKADDSFELYDLRVEVVCPPNERILCGAKDGDYFILEGEMLKLPPGQGISIYSLSTDEGFGWSLNLTTRTRCRAAAPCRKTEGNTPERLDDHRCRDCVSRHPRCWPPSLLAVPDQLSCPDPHCKSRMKITRIKKRVFSHSTVTAVPLPPDSSSGEEQDEAHDNPIGSIVENSERGNTVH